jgi:hypothetical protein
MEEATQTQLPVKVPENFCSTISDFASDLTTTFPEFSTKWTKWTSPETTTQEYDELFAYCLGVYPTRFFEILNQNSEIFNQDSDVNTSFLPGVDFKVLYHCEGITEKTRETIWKYLQLILFLLVGTMKDKMDFGDAMNAFDKMGETDLEGKLQDTMSNIHTFFSNMESSKSSSPDRATPNMPQPEQIHDHLMGLFDGKIGKLAKDLAENLTEDLQESLGIDLTNIGSSQDVLKQLMRNPGKISGLVKTVGEKLNECMSSGEISRQDLLTEAGTMMRKMQEMGGGDMGAMFKNIARAMGTNLPNEGRFDQNAFAQMEQLISPQARTTDAQSKRNAEQELKAKQQKQREDEYAKFMAANPNIFNTEDPNSLVYRLDGEKQERSGLKPPGSSKNKKKKGGK